MQENVFIVLLAAGNESKPKKEGKQYLADEALKLNFSSRMSQIYALASTTVHKNRRKKNNVVVDGRLCVHTNSYLYHHSSFIFFSTHSLTQHINY